MRKKRILFCSEATFLNSGYAVYTKEILTYLHSTGKYELAELAATGQVSDPRGRDVPWQYYGVQPNIDYEPKASQEEVELYMSNKANSFGQYRFEDTCLKFKPDIVFDIRDYWFCEFLDRSPFRPFYHLVLMPTVDAAPQARQWLEMYARADAIFNYSEFGMETLEKETGGKIKPLGTAPAGANPAFRPKDLTKCREDLRIDSNPDLKIVGTVMRNQRRKLFPDLFASWAQFLSKQENPENYLLYCHTKYPDLGWNIPELLIQYGVADNVLFTYQCPTTNKIFASKFSGSRCQSPFTGKFEAEMCGAGNGTDNEQLSSVFNCFNAYVQYANSEGLGLPAIEAAACGVPVMEVDYSAMASVVRNLNGIPLKVKALYTELETGCKRAVPDNDHLIECLENFFDMSPEALNELKEATLAGYKEHYQWEQSGQRLEACFDALPIRPETETWKSPPRINQPAQCPKEIPPNTSPGQFVAWLVRNVLGEPKQMHQYMTSRLIRDLTYGCRTSTTGGMYQNESSQIYDGQNSHIPFNHKDAYNEMLKIADKRNFWEKIRTKGMK